MDVLVDGLVNEQSTLSPDDAGPCLEYIVRSASVPNVHLSILTQCYVGLGMQQLTNNIFSSLAQAATTDQPVGLLGLVIRAFDNLVILLGEAFVTFGHRSLNHLLHECIEHEDGSIKHVISQEPSNAQLKIKSIALPYEEELASLACSLCSRIKTQPDLLPLFFHDKRLLNRSKTSVQGTAFPTVHVRHEQSPLSISPTSQLSPQSSVPLSACSSQASLSSTASTSDGSATGPASATLSTVESRQYTFLIFDFLIRLLHRHGRIGELARTGLLFIIDLAMSTAKVKVASTSTFTSALPPAFPILTSSKTNKTTAKTGAKRPSSRRLKRKAVIGQSDRFSLLSYIEDSDFADVLAAGLGAALSVLPSHLYVPLPGMLAHPDELHLSPPTVSDGHTHALDAIHEHGITVSTDPEVKECLGLFVSIIDFATDVTRKAPKRCHEDANPKLGSEATTASVSHKMQSLTASIRSSFGTVFLHNALLSRLVDAASPTAEDAAIISVLTYLDTLIRSLEPETPLFEEAVSALLSCQEDQSSATEEGSAMRDNLRRILMYSLTSHIGAAPTPLAESLSHSLQLSALRLLHTLLDRADWAALELFNIHPSLGCTCFPYPAPEDQVEEDGAFVYPDDDESDQDSFIYPSEDDHRKSIAAFAASSARARPQNISKEGPNLDVFLQLISTSTRTFPTPSIPPDRKSLSRHSSKSSIDAPRQSDTLAHNSMAFTRYLRQAELSIQRDQSFVRGCAIISASDLDGQTLVEAKASLSKIPTIHLGDTSIDSGTSSLQSGTTMASDHITDAIQDRMVQHKIILHLGIVARLDALLSTFFINEPAVNLALTRNLAKLAVCPYRSLEGWLISTKSGGTLASLDTLRLPERLGLIVAAHPNLALRHSSPHERSDNSKVTDWLRQNSLAHRTQRTLGDAYEADEDEGILAKQAALLDEVQDTHRSQFKDFDRLLQERRQNMLFVDDLAEAMQGESTSGSPLEASSSSWHAPLSSMARMPGSLSSPLRTRQRVDSSATEREYLNSLSPYANHVRETSSKLITVRLEGQAEPKFATNPIDGAPLSKFWSANSAHMDHDSDEENAEIANTPRKSRFGSHLGVNTNLMLLSDLKSPMTPGDQENEPSKEFHEVQVSFSKYLDNLVILEESFKELVAIVVTRMRIGIDPLR